MLSIYQINNPKNPSFCGLSRQLRRRPYADATEILEKVEKYSKANGIAGNLPRSWIEKLPLQDRGECIKDVYKEFGDAIMTIEQELDWIYNIREDSGRVTKPTQAGINKAKEKIASVLEKHGIVKNGKEVQMGNIEEGSYGSVQKLTVNGEEFALKVFISLDKMLNSLIKAFDGDKQRALNYRLLDCLKDCHGIHIEANRAAYLNTRQNSRFNKTFFADFTNGGMLSKILDDTTQEPPLVWIPLKCYGLEASGEELDRNSINEIVYDFGGILRRDDSYNVLAENNTARRIYNQFRHTPKEKRQNKFDSFSKQYEKCKESWVEKLKNLLYLEFQLGASPFKFRRKTRNA